MSIASHYRNAVPVCPKPKVDKRRFDIVPDTCSSCAFMRETINDYGCFRKSGMQSERRILRPSEETCENYKRK